MANLPPRPHSCDVTTDIAVFAALDAWGGSGWKNQVVPKATNAPILMAVQHPWCNLDGVGQICEHPLCL